MRNNIYINMLNSIYSRTSVATIFILYSYIINIYIIYLYYRYIYYMLGSAPAPLMRISGTENRMEFLKTRNIY